MENLIGELVRDLTELLNIGVSIKGGSPLNKRLMEISKLEMAGIGAFDKKYMEIIRRMLDFVKSSQHFRMPDGGMIFDDNLKGLRDTQLRLPYKKIIVTYETSQIRGAYISKRAKQEGHKGEFKHINKSVICCEELTRLELIEEEKLLPVSSFDRAVLGEMLSIYDNDYFIKIMPILFSNKCSMWCPYFVERAWLLPSRWDRPDGLHDDFFHYLVDSGAVKSKRPFLAGGYFRGFSETLDMFTLGGRKTTEPTIRQWKDAGSMLRLYRSDYEAMYMSVLELTEALQCANVKEQIISPPKSASNEKRLKKGKAPFFEYKVLVIDSHVTDGGHSDDAADDRASPRQHLRRGHIRKLQDGRKIWINSCVVGSVKQGVIDKSYLVKKMRPTHE